MANGGNIEFGIGFNVDKSALIDLQSQLKGILSMDALDLKLGSDSTKPIEEIKKGLQDKADKQKDDLATAENAALKIIDRQIEKQKELRDEKEAYWDEEISNLEKANKETEKAIELARLEEALENAKNEKTKRVKYMLSIKIAQNGENPEEDNTVGKICFEI